MIIHTRPTKSIPSIFVEADFTLPCDKSPDWLFTAQPIQQFRLSRLFDYYQGAKSDDTEVMTEFMREEQENGSSTTTNVPCWKRPPGTEDESLPFGNILPIYQSADLPLLPIV